MIIIKKNKLKTKQIKMASITMKFGSLALMALTSQVQAIDFNVEDFIRIREFSDHVDGDKIDYPEQIEALIDVVSRLAEAVRDINDEVEDHGSNAPL